MPKPGWKDAKWAGPDFFHGVWGDGAGQVWAVGQVWGGRTGIAYSKDGGRTWRPEPRPGKDDLNAVCGDGAGTVYAAGGQGVILRRTGEAWERVRAGLKNWPTALHWHEGQLYLGDHEGGLRRSADSGKTWELVRPGDGQRIWTIAGAPGRPLYAAGVGRTLLRSEDGRRWGPLPVKLPREAGPAYAPEQNGPEVLRVWASPEGQVLVCAWERRLLLSTDQGQRWQVQQLSDDAREGDLGGVTGAGGTWLAWTLTTVRRSEDGGQTWAVEHQRPSEEHSWFDAIWLGPDGSAVGVGTHGTLLRRGATSPSRAPAGRSRSAPSRRRRP